VTGNEYDDHLKAKVRVAAMMIQLGFKNIEFEKELPYEAAGNMRVWLSPVDVYGEYRTAKLAVNVDGKTGHASRRSLEKARHRKRYLREGYNIVLLHVPVGNFDDKMDNETIKAELLEAVLR